ncbi:hypothetical protein OCF84_20635 (plasmid) [Shewanella xiamenensis]|uniref:Uncharacterized protein n=1 Tax=Shewanella xiamenensis TaxID=332186 RepID=A0ABT6UFS8_9GAMM|nr:hypothetical protein [Shewanella xiamenensis]MDI5833323.1 hypothetical protein [Shewanella xiamenensis]WHF57925.1 hypothetical protein OCF84_20635 [Shewanella xiamenensis]
MITNELQYLLSVEQINSELIKKVVLSPNPDWLNNLIEAFKRDNYCHFNAMKLVEVLNSKIPHNDNLLKTEIKYVLGLIAGLDVHEHAFIKIGNNYYDPANDLRVREYDVYSLLEINQVELIELLDKHDMHEFGLLLMTLRKDEDFSHLFIANFDTISADIELELINYLQQEESMKHGI